MIGRAWTAMALLSAGCAIGGSGARESPAPVEPGVLEGRVMDDLGNPVAGVRVDVCGPPHESRWGPAYPGIGEAETADDGSFRLGGIPSGPCFVSVYAHDLVPISFLPVTAPARDLELVCPRWGRVRFRLVPPAGAKPPERVANLSGSSPVHRPGSREAGPVGGDFECGDYAPGPRELEIAAPGWAPVVATFVAEPGRTVDIGALPLDPGHTLQGRVVDGEGRPIAGARMYAPAYFGAPWYSTTTDTGGSFRIDHLPAGEVFFWADAEGYGSRPMSLRIPTGAEEIRIPLIRGGILRVHVRMRTCGAPFGCTVEVVNLDHPDPRMDVTEGQIDGDGDFAFSLPAGRYRVEHLCGGGDVARLRDVDLPVAGEVTVEFADE